jgi:hypothetical protein
LVRWRNCFSKLINVYGFNALRNTDIQTTELREPEPSAYVFEVTIEKLKSHKSSGTDEIPAEFVKTGE